jgi:hypothetical protein
MENTNQNFEFNVAEGVKELIIRQGTAAKIFEYTPYSIEKASIGAVHEYLRRAGIDDELIKDSFVVYSYENLYLDLQFGVRLGLQDKINGVLKLHPELEAWQINKGKKYTNMEMSDFIKMNRHYFENKDAAMRLVSELRNLKVKTEREAEHSDDKRGDYKIMASQKVIDSNIPDSFILKLPVFVGTEPVSVAVEIEVSAHDFGCNLISPDLKQIIDQETKAIIDAELAAIRALYPELRIFQK